MAKRRSFTLIEPRLTPSGLWDNGKYQVSAKTVSIPATKLAEAIIVSLDEGVEGVKRPCTRIIIDGEKYLVVGRALPDGKILTA